MLPHLIRLHGPWQIGNADTSNLSGTVEMPGLAAVPNQEGISLVRKFQWVATLESDEQVALLFEGIVPAAEVILNGISLGSTHDPWGIHRFDVSGRLLPRNELALQFEKGFDQVGVRRLIALCVESRLVQLASAEWEWNDANQPNALRGKLLLVSSGPPLPIEILLELNGQTVWQKSLTLEQEQTTVEISAGPFDLDSWRPRRWGLPVRQEVHLVVQRAGDDGSILHEESWQAGFRHLDLMPDYDKPAMIDTHGRDELRIKRLSQAAVLAWNDDDPASLFGNDFDVDMIVLESVLAPERLYDLADRMGIMVKHEVAGDLALERAVRRLSRHPSVLERF